MLIENLILVALSIGLFYAMNFTGTSFREYQVASLTSNEETSPAFNLLFRILMPNVYVVICGFFFKILEYPSIISYLWIIVPIQITIRLIFNLRRLKIIHWPRFIFTAVVSTSIAYFAARRILETGTLLFPDLSTLGGEFWVLVIIYLYTSFSHLLANSLKSENKEISYINHSYIKIKNQFGSDIEKYDLWPKQQAFIYALIIVENFNRPLGVRITERLTSCFRDFGTYGIMQVRSKKPLSDSESINQGIAIVLDLYEKIFSKTKLQNPTYPDDYLESSVWRRVAWFYNRHDSYADVVIKVWYDVQSIQKKSTNPITTEQLDELRLDAFFNAETR